MKSKILICSLLTFIFAGAVSAHQPRLVYRMSQSSENNPIVISNPDISQAFYGILDGNSDYYQLVLPSEQEIYLNLLLPDLSHVKYSAGKAVEYDKNVYVTLIGNKNKQEIKLGGADTFKEKFFEEFAGDNYLRGPEVKQLLPADTYRIKVSSVDKPAKYVFVIGEKETFPANEGINAIKSLPDLKVNFFEKSVFTSYWNKIGLGLGIIFVVFILVLIFLVWFGRFIYRKIKK